LLARYFKEKGLEDAIAFAPGKRGLDMAMEADHILRGGYGCLVTERDRITGKVKVVEIEYDVRNRDVIIFDDIISTGGTMVESVKFLKKRRARSVYVACVHPLLISDALQRILNSGAKEVVGTNTIPGPVSVVSVAPVIAEALK
jgi:ribose-phosphate pyrophosphokinase